MLVLLLALATAYVFGTFPSADIAAHIATAGKHDIRTLGTGNPGAANVKGELGSKWGAFVLALDVIKGALACGIARWMVNGDAASYAGVAAVVGHCFPLWNGFRGGKGVATAGGQVLATLPMSVPVIAVAAFIGSKRAKRSRAAAANYAALVAWIAMAGLWTGVGWPNLWGPAAGAALFESTVATCVVITYRFVTSGHHDAAARATTA